MAAAAALVGYWDLVESRIILGLCDRFHCIPEAAYRMDANVLRLLEIEALTRPEGGEE